MNFPMILSIGFDCSKNSVGDVSIGFVFWASSPYMCFLVLDMVDVLDFLVLHD